MLLNDDDLRELKERAGIAKAFADTFSSDSGKRVLEFLGKRFFAGRTTLSEQEGPLPIDPLKLAIREGMRTVVLFCRDLAEFNLSEAWAVIHQEETERRMKDKPAPSRTD